MNSKSDAKLREELDTAGNKGSKPARTNKPARASKADSDTGTGDGAKVTRPRIAPGTPPCQVLAAHLTDADALHEASRLSKSDESNAGTYKTLGERIDKLAKKVGEKAVNLLRNRSNPGGVQVYTRIAMDQLIAQGSITSKQLADTYRGTYKEGTARAQSNQIMQLFPALNVAERTDRSTLKLNKDSVIVAEYRKAAKRAAA